MAGYFRGARFGSRKCQTWEGAVGRAECPAADWRARSRPRVNPHRGRGGAAWAKPHRGRGGVSYGRGYAWGPCGEVSWYPSTARPSEIAFRARLRAAPPEPVYIDLRYSTRSAFSPSLRPSF